MKNTILQDVHVLYLAVISYWKRKSKESNTQEDYFVHVVTNNHRIHSPRPILHRNDQKHKRTHKETATTDSPHTRTSPVLHERQYTPRKKDTDNSQLASRRTWTHIRSARETFEWRASPFVLRTTQPLTRVESLFKKGNIRAHICYENNKSNGKRISVMYLFKGNSDGVT